MKCEYCGQAQVDGCAMGRLLNGDVCPNREAYEALRASRRVAGQYETLSPTPTRYLSAKYDSSFFGDDHAARRSIERCYKALSKEIKDVLASKTRNGRMIVIKGPNGCGKTFAAYAAVSEARKIGLSAFAISAIDLMRLLRSSFHDNPTVSEEEIADAVENADLFFLDDLGYQKDTAYSLETVMWAIDHRWKWQKCTILCLNHNYKDLINRAGKSQEMRVWLPVADRLKNSVVIEVEGTSKRVRELFEETTPAKADIPDAAANEKKD